MRELFASGITHDWYVLTRSDYVYVCDVVDVRALPPAAYSPLGQEYDGYTDRFHIVHRRFVLQAIADPHRNQPRRILLLTMNIP